MAAGSFYGEVRAYEIVEEATGKVVETLELNDRGHDGLRRKVDFDRFYIREKDA